MPGRGLCGVVQAHNRRGTRERKACANRCANADVIAAEVRAAVDVERDVPAQHDEHARLRDAPNITLGHRGRRDQRDAEHLVLRRLARVEAEHSGWLLPVCFFTFLSASTVAGCATNDVTTAPTVSASDSASAIGSVLVDHERVRRWVDTEIVHGWAFVAITQNGFVRITSQPRNPSPVPPAQAIGRLARAAATEHHEYRLCSVSLLDDALTDYSRLRGHRQVTDAYLLALATANGGRFATLDQSLPIDAFRHASARNLTLI